MEYSSILQVNKEAGDAINYLMDGTLEYFIYSDIYETEETKSFIASFNNGFELEITIVYAKKPYIESRLYDTLGNIVAGDIRESIEGEYIFHYSGDEYRLNVEFTENFSEN